MNTPLWVDSTLVLDPRRAVWLPVEQTLVFADLHLGYSWAHRSMGHLLPLSGPEETVARLLAVAADYQPRRMVLLGDIIHRAVDVAPLRTLLSALLDALGERAETILVEGNHDAGLPALLESCGWNGSLHREYRAGPHHLLHGDREGTLSAAERLAEARSGGGFVVIGHEHPAVTLGDGVATRVKCPCFLLGEGLVILPAFSGWAAGGHPRPGKWLSPLPYAAPPTQAVAIVGPRLLRLPV